MSVSAVIKIDDTTIDNTAVVELEVDGAKSAKVVALTDITQILLGNEAMMSGVLPTGTVLFGRQLSSDIIFMTSPAKRRTLIYEVDRDTEVEYTMLMPPAAMYVKLVPVNEGRSSQYTNLMSINNTRIFALKSLNKIDHSTMLYEYPVPNVSVGGSICWGNVALPHFNKQDYSNLHILFDMFFDSIFNSDLSSNRINKNIPLLSVYNKVVGTKSKRFPLNMLMQYVQLERFLHNIGR